MRVLIAAGGTAGHINPALAIAGALKKADPTAEIHFAGRKEGMEYRLVTQAGYPFHHIEITGFQRKLSLHNIKRNIVTLWNLALSGPKAKAIMKEVQPDLVIGCGGYVSGPVVRCAAKMGIHTALHEQNAFPGVTNMQSDYKELICGLNEVFDFRSSSDAFVFMGHGTGHFANACYPALEHQIQAQGFTNVWIGTVEGYPEITDVKEKLKQLSCQKSVLAPLMLVAGDHARNDMAGEDENSWKNILERDGIEADCMIAGLGSYAFVQRMFAEHALQAEEIR